MPETNGANFNYEKNSCMNFPGAALFASSRGGVFHHLAVSVVSCNSVCVCERECVPGGAKSIGPRCTA